MTTFRSFPANFSKSIAKCLASRSRQICRISLRQNRKEKPRRVTIRTPSETAWIKGYVTRSALTLIRIQSKAVHLLPNMQMLEGHLLNNSIPLPIAVMCRHFRTRAWFKKQTRLKQKRCRMRCRGTKNRCWTRSASTNKYSNITLKRLRTTRKRCKWRMKWDALNTWETRRNCSSRLKLG